METVEGYILKNFFSTTSNKFTSFHEVEDGYEWSTSKIDGSAYTCMKHEDHVKIFHGHIHYTYFNSTQIIIDFDL